MAKYFRPIKARKWQIKINLFTNDKNDVDVDVDVDTISLSQHKGEGLQ